MAIEIIGLIVTVGLFLVAQLIVVVRWGSKLTIQVEVMASEVSRIRKQMEKIATTVSALPLLEDRLTRLERQNPSAHPRT